MAKAKDIIITRRFAAPRALVFRNWIDADSLKHWFAPDTFTCTEAKVNARPGGQWRIAYQSAAGDKFVESGVFQEVDAPDRIVLTLTQQMPGRTYPPTTIAVVFTEFGAETEMMFRQTGFDSEQRREGNQMGWMECFKKLALRLAS